MAAPTVKGDGAAEQTTLSTRLLLDAPGRLANRLKEAIADASREL
jgi:hypothetical protein